MDSISPGMDTYIISIQKMEVRQTMLSSFSSSTFLIVGTK